VKSTGARVSRGYSHYVLGLLFVVYVFNFIDRQVLSILLEDIKQEIGVSDSYMGFLSGPAFVLFYTFAGIPIARLADRTSRRSIIALGLAVWSSMTAVSGLAQNFVHLALARVGVGIGEAAGSPPAHSLLSDYFPPERRATALSIYATGVYVGVMVAFLAGSRINAYFGWRTVYLALGLTGIPLALLVRASIRELPRGSADAVHSEQAGGPEGSGEFTSVPFAEVLRVLLRCPSFLWITLAASIQSLSGYGVLTWGPTFLRRVHRMDGIEVGDWLGVSVGVAGTAGAYLGGRMCDRLGEEDPRWYMLLPAAQSVLGVPFVVGFLLFENQLAALWCFVPFYLLGAMYVGPMLSMIQSLVQPSMRATTSAILLFVLNLVGLGVGPWLVGGMNDLLAPTYGPEAIRYSLLLLGVLGGFASLAFLQASRNLRRDLAQNWEATPQRQRNPQTR